MGYHIRAYDAKTGSVIDCEFIGDTIVVVTIADPSKHGVEKRVYQRVDNAVEREKRAERRMKVARVTPLCLGCGEQLPREIKVTGLHDATCPWNYYIKCQSCGYQNSLSKLLGFWAGCSKKCRKRV